jgi:hypothetical protein
VSLCWARADPSPDRGGVGNSRTLADKARDRWQVKAHMSGEANGTPTGVPPPSGVVAGASLSGPVHLSALQLPLAKP